MNQVGSDRNRKVVAETCGGKGLDILMASLQKNCERDERLCRYQQKRAGRESARSSGDEEGDKQRREAHKVEGMVREINEMLVKLIRLVANLSINRDGIGDRLAKAPEIVNLVHLLRKHARAYAHARWFCGSLDLCSFLLVGE